MQDQDKTSSHSSKPILKPGRQLDALRACALYSGGMRSGAFPTAMRQLVELGLAEERAIGPRNRASAWFITRAGRDELAAHRRGSDDA